MPACCRSYPRRHCPGLGRCRNERCSGMIHAKWHPRIEYMPKKWIEGRLSMHARLEKQQVPPWTARLSFIPFVLLVHPSLNPLSALTRSHSLKPNKMPSIRQILPVLTTAASVEAAMGPAFSTGPVGSGSWIRESTSTLVLPKTPSNNAGDASLWVGMGTSNGDLIQSIADAYQSTSSWSIFAYTLLSTGANSQMPVQTEGTNAVATEQITMYCQQQGTLL